MESKANYTLVGIFVFIFTLSLAGFAFWLGKYGNQSESFHFYKIHIRDSVSGLNEESPVKFRGMDVGLVENIRINPKDSETIEVFLKVRPDTPIKTDSVATVGSQGLTGLSYIEIQGGTKEALRLETDIENPALIKTEESFFTTLKSSATDISGKVSILLDKFDVLLSTENIHNINESMRNIKLLTNTLNDKMEKFDSVITNANRVLEKTVEFEDGAINALENIDREIATTNNEARKALEKISVASEDASSFIATMKTTVARGDYNVKEISKESLDRLNELLQETKILVLNAQEAVDRISDSPSDLLFKSEVVKTGPGE